MPGNRRPLPHPGSWSVLGLFTAIIIGFLAASQPITVSVPLIAAVGTFLAVLISPLASIAILLVVAPLRALLATAGAWPLPFDIGQLMFLAAIGASVVHYVIRPGSQHGLYLPKITLSPIYIPVILFIAASGLTVFNAVSIGTWLTEWLKWLSVLIMMFMVENTAGKNRWQWIVFILIAAALANALVGIFIFLGGSGADHFAINDRFFRAFGTFEQPNPFGGFMGLIAPLSLMMTYASLSQLIKGRLRHKRVSRVHLYKVLFYSIASIIIVLALFMSWSRGAWLGFAASAGVMIFLLPRKLWYSIAISLASIVMIASLWFAGLIPSSVMERVTSATSEYFTLYDVRGVDITPLNYAVVERLAHWQAALNMARENPWLGVGLGNYEVAYDDYRLINWQEALGHAHNYYLNILGEAGIIGAFCYVAMWLSILYFTWRIRQHPDQFIRSIGIGLVAAWVYLAIHGLLDNLYVNNLFLHIGTLLGLLVVLYRQTVSDTKVRVA